MSIIFNLIVIAMVAFIAYMWSQEGLLSSFIHFLCTVIAGAVALAVWEPLAYIMMGVREDIAWSVSLALPFLVTLAALRVLMDVVIKYNMKFSNVANMIGGGVFGVGSGIIAVGILVISMGFLRLPAGFLGYKPIAYDGQGNLVRSGGLWLPADKLTAELYERLSVTGFASATPLALMSPNINEQAALMRITFDDRARNTMSPDDFVAIGRYTVSAANPNELFENQQVRDLDGKPFPSGTTIEGFVMRFESGAKEGGGQIVFGSGQVSLIYEDADGRTHRAQPIALVTQAKSDRVSYGRFRFDADEAFLASVGAASNATMAFEFPVPPRATPTFVLVKNIRVPVDRYPPLPIEDAQGGTLTTAQRDAAIDAEQILVGSVALADGSSSGGSSGGPVPINRGGTVISGVDADELRNSGVKVSTKLKFGFRKGNRGGIEIDSDNKIIRGEKLFSELSADIPTKLRVDEFYTDSGTTLVQIDVSWESRISILGKTLDAALRIAPVQLRAPGYPPFEVVGYIFKDNNGTKIRYDRGNPVRAFSQLPQVSQSKPDDKLTLLFLVDKNKNVEISTLQVGTKPIVTFDPPMPTIRRF